MKNPGGRTEDILVEARARLKVAIKAELDIRETAMEDMRFVAGEQWPETVKNERQEENRPLLTFNKMRKFVDIQIGEQRLNRPAMKVAPVDDAGDEVIAKIYSELMRHIERISNADQVYDTAHATQLAGGLGYWRIVTEYAEDDSFDQDIKLKRIRNPMSVYMDRSGSDFLNRDAKYAFITDVISKEEFEEKWPDKYPSQFEAKSYGEDYVNWFLDEKVRIAEYFWRTPTTKTLLQLESGEVVEENKKDGITKEFFEGRGFKVIKERKVKTHKVMWAKISGSDILEGPNEWAGSYIPIIPVYGKEMDLEGKVIYASLIRDAKDAQRMYNYWQTAATELVALAPKAPHLVTPKQIKGHERAWNEANRRNRPYLPYNYDSQAGKPTREPPGTIPTGAVNQSATADADIKDTIGLYEASLGQRGNERSGKAIMERKKSSELGTFVFLDNMAQSITYSAQQIIELIPKVYDSERMFRILGPEDAQQLMVINKVIEDPLTGDTIVINDITRGKYDVVGISGVSYSTKRAEAADAMMQFVQYAPELAPLLMDIIAEVQEWPGAEKFAERIKKTLPPELQDEQPTGGVPGQQGPLQLEGPPV